MRTDLSTPFYHCDDNADILDGRPEIFAIFY